MRASGCCWTRGHGGSKRPDEVSVPAIRTSPTSGLKSSGWWFVGSLYCLLVQPWELAGLMPFTDSRTLAAVREVVAE